VVTLDTLPNGPEVATRPARGASALVIAAVAPLLIVFPASVWVVIGWASGASPFWPQPQMTMSEAAGLSNAGEVVRLITIEHQDPNRAWPVRQGILGDPQVVTPLEAAVAIRRIELVRVLLRHGVTVPDSGPVRAALICRAEAAAAADIADLLLHLGDGSDPRTGCVQPLH
jgi:hypothetical protein